MPGEPLRNWRASGVQAPAKQGGQGGAFEVSVRSPGGSNPPGEHDRGHAHPRVPATDLMARVLLPASVTRPATQMCDAFFGSRVGDRHRSQSAGLIPLSGFNRRWSR